MILEDIDECKEMENLCGNGRCSNTFGSFMCSCNRGYRLNAAGSLCVGQSLVQEEDIFGA